MRKQKRARRPMKEAISLLIVTFALVAGTLFVLSYFDPHPVLQRLSTDNGVRVTILSQAHHYGISKPLSVSIANCNGKEYGPSLVGTTAWKNVELTFAIRSSGTLHAVYETSYPRLILAIFDCGSGEAWPFERSGDTVQEKRQRGLRLIERLKAIDNDNSLKLRDDATLEDHSASHVH